jgi:hypothetical protein
MWRRNPQINQFLNNAAFWNVAPCRHFTLKMKAIRFSETSVHTRSPQRYIPEDGILHSHRCENLKTCKSTFVFHCLKNRVSSLRLTAYALLLCNAKPSENVISSSWEDRVRHKFGFPSAFRSIEIFSSIEFVVYLGQSLPLFSFLIFSIISLVTVHAYAHKHQKFFFFSMSLRFV